ncbi:hypothetical protein LTS09_013363 [Friedmanniomyces endolithicus]|nr:hypothetical protein LTS09_013363 [Friedmanniomyces endolithicus]
MKPLVSAFNAWTCITISLFAIVILSVIGSMFAHGNHSMMGSDEDPQDGGKVAAAVFGAVGVYGVSTALHYITRWDEMRCSALRSSGGGTGGRTGGGKVFLLFCGCQALVHRRQSRQGEIALR